MSHSSESRSCERKRHRRRKRYQFIKYLKSKLIKTRRLKADCVTSDHIRAKTIEADEIVVRNPQQGPTGARGTMIRDDSYIPQIITEISTRAEGNFIAAYALPALIPSDFTSPTNCGKVMSQAFTNINMTNDLNQLRELDLITFLAYTRVDGISVESFFYNTQTRTWEVPGGSIEPYVIFNLNLIEPTTGGDKTVNLATAAVLTPEELIDVSTEQNRLIGGCGGELPNVGQPDRIVYTNVIKAKFDVSQPFQPLVFTSYSANYVDARFA